MKFTVPDVVQLTGEQLGRRRIRSGVEQQQDTKEAASGRLREADGPFLSQQVFS